MVNVTPVVTKLIWIDTDAWCGGVVVDETYIIVKAPPIAAGWIGKGSGDMLRWYKSKGRLRQWSEMNDG